MKDKWGNTDCSFSGASGFQGQYKCPDGHADLKYRENQDHSKGAT